MKKVVYFLCAVLLLLVSFSYTFKRLEVTSSYYNNYEELISVPNIFESGWIPRWLPKTAFQIKESHDIDTNESWIAFKFPPSEKFFENCRMIEKKDVNLPTTIQVNRFPDFVIEAIESTENDSLRYFSCDKKQDSMLLVNESNLSAFIWNNGFREQ